MIDGIQAQAKVNLLRAKFESLIAAENTAHHGGRQLTVLQPRRPGMAPVKTTSQSVVAQEAAAYKQFLKTDAQARQSAMVKFSKACDWNIELLSEMSAEFGRISQPTFKRAYDTAVNNGCKAPDALKVACKETRDLGIGYLKNSEHAGYQAYAEFLEQHNPTFLDVTSTYTNLTHIRINYVPGNEIETAEENTEQQVKSHVAVVRTPAPVTCVPASSIQISTPMEEPPAPAAKPLAPVMASPESESQTLAEPAPHSEDGLQTPAYEAFMDNNNEARQTAEIAYAEKYGLDSDSLQEAGYRFMDIAGPAFDIEYSNALGQGIEESDALKFSYKQATEIAVLSFRDSADSTDLLYADFIEQHELLFADVALPGYIMPHPTINYQWRPQPVETVPDLDPAPQLEETAHTFPETPAAALTEMPTIQEKIILAAAEEAIPTPGSSGQNAGDSLIPVPAAGQPVAPATEAEATEAPLADASNSVPSDAVVPENLQTPPTPRKRPGRVRRFFEKRLHITPKQKTTPPNVQVQTESPASVIELIKEDLLRQAVTHLNNFTSGEFKIDAEKFVNLHHYFSNAYMTAYKKSMAKSIARLSSAGMPLTPVNIMLNMSSKAPDLQLPPTLYPGDQKVEQSFTLMNKLANERLLLQKPAKQKRNVLSFLGSLAKPADH